MTCNYTAEDKNVMRVSAQAKNKSRLQELIDFAKISGFKKIGVANCKGVQELADRFIALLREQGLEVVSVNCKESGLDGCEIWSLLRSGFTGSFSERTGDGFQCQFRPLSGTWLIVSKIFESTGNDVFGKRFCS